jgi:hypothetical protein
MSGVYNAVAGAVSDVAASGEFVYSSIAHGSLSQGAADASNTYRSTYNTLVPGNPDQQQAAEGSGQGGAPGSGPAANQPGAPIDYSQQEASMTDVVKNEYASDVAAINAQQSALGQKIGSMQTQESQAEGTIKASAAGRGIKLTGSPLMQLISQQTGGESAIQFEQSQGESALQGAQTSASAWYSGSLIGIQKQNWQLQQDVTNQWLQTFADVASIATGVPIPAPSAGESSPTTDYSGSDPYGWGGGGGEEW